MDATTSVKPLSSISSTLAATISPLEGDDMIAGKTFLVVLCGILHRLDIYKQAHAQGAKFVIIDEKVTDWATPYVEHWILSPHAYNPDKVIPIVTDWMAAHPEVKFDAVLTFDEYAILACGRLVDHFGFPGTPFETVQTVKNKFKLRQLTQAAGVLAPQTLHFSVSSLCAGELDAALAAFPFPCVLKPLSGAGSHFVRRVADAATLKAVVAEYRDEAASTGEVAAWGAEPADSAFMAEELLVGKEVDIDLLISHGRIEYLTISDNFPSAGPAELFMEAGGALPSTLPAAAQEGLRAMTHQVVATFGTALHGCYHFEAMWTDRGAFPIELNQRLGGSEVLVLALSVYGVNLGVQALRLALGKPVATVDTAAPRRYCTSTNFLAPDSGYITRVGCSAAVPGDSAYMGSMHRAQPGHPLKAPPLGFEFLGWMVAAGEDFPAAKAALDRLSAEFFCDLREFERGDPHGVVPGTDVYYKDWTGAKPAAEAAVAAGAVCPIGATAAICLAAATIDAGAAVAPAEVDAAPSAAAAQ